jgi:hypothetical protein
LEGEGAMISVIVWVDAGEDRVRARLASRTLAALVPLAVEGLVRDVSLMADKADAVLRELADDSGADLYEIAGKNRAVAAMKAESGLILSAGVGFSPGLIEELGQFLSSGRLDAALIHQRGAGWVRDVMWRQTGGIIAPRAILLQASSLAPQKLKRHLTAPRVFKARLEPATF